jgi:hypothetical protein
MKTRNFKGAIKYIVLYQEGTCGHKHRCYNRAIDCFDKIEDKGIEAMIAETRYNPDLLWIENCLLKNTSMVEMKTALMG